MTPKQILDSFSETLMRDDRILSSRERELLTSLLHHAKSATHETEQTQEAVQRVIASAVGETVAQRAFSVLGGSIVQHILEGSAASRNEGRTGNDELTQGYSAVMTDPPKPPGPQPPGSPLRTPGVPAPSPGPQPPGSPLRVPKVPPSPGPQPPGQRRHQHCRIQCECRC